jgi:hypothetical protein
VDELLLLCNSEEFFENAEAVATLRGLMLENPNFQPPEAFARQLDPCSRHKARDRLWSLSMPPRDRLRPRHPGAGLEVDRDRLDFIAEHVPVAV